MRKLALFTLVSYLALTLTAFSPLALADEETEIDKYDVQVCSFSQEIDETEQIEQTKKDAESGDYKGTCGETPNIATGSLEKGDCTAEGKVITEISEVIGSDTSTGEGDEESKIVTVYKGVCCFVVKRDDNGKVTGCKEERTVYATTYTGCTELPASYCSKVQWIISTSGAGIIKVYVKQLYRWAAMTVGFIAVVTIVVSGIQITVSGVSGDISSAKSRILKAISGLVLLFLSGIILYTINPTFFS